MPQTTLGKNIVALLVLSWAGAAWALPQVDCPEGVLVGTDAEAVAVSLDGRIEEIGPEDLPLQDFCDDNPGFVGYVLPVPKPKDDEPDQPRLPEPPAPGGPGAEDPMGPARALSGRSFDLDRSEGDDDEASSEPADPPPARASASDEPAAEIAEPAPSPARAYGEAAPNEPQAPDGSVGAAGCDAAPDRGRPSALALLGLLLLGLRRTGGAR